MKVTETRLLLFWLLCFWLVSGAFFIHVWFGAFLNGGEIRISINTKGEMMGELYLFFFYFWLHFAILFRVWYNLKRNQKETNRRIAMIQKHSSRPILL